ncbi:hypothetical protein PF005_g12902 [Phytophthora fragariae]|uniref:Uncharacterized protein n=2 Tax=Phytophthora fragariae TaxID=53985 RepID=A0A6A3YVY2_9STRA|nr:hypothetical protein PF009_g14097 [Phytophthora fragariae]KAE9005756.1 hypothetical protein PF011_g11894 [Phytophthora fragariae]KAE9106966.1 hypothetical protein PF007_g13205 [Phytophthora fragariae]KAE9142871.1 hypothetical protein PF006_g12058 [Phytophthora fragariae]KAE9206721.1 hypothetical protein PF005_g12902 [Phytophthora fragariae]
MWRADGSTMERAVRSPQSRHRKRRLLEATQHASPPSERLLVEGLAAQVAAGHNADDAETVNACVRVLRNAKNCVYMRALAARALGLLMLESRALADRLRLETEGLVDALLQVVGYCRRSKTQTADTRRVHVNCCLVISLLMQAPSQQRHLQLVVSLDSELLVLQPQPVERESANLLLTVASRPESGDTSRQLNDEADAFVPGNVESVPDTKKKTKRKRRRQAGGGPPSPTRAARSTNQQSPPRPQRPKVAWTEGDGNLDDGPSALGPPGSSNVKRGVGQSAADSLAADVARRETPSRIFKMERYRVVTPVFPRQYMLDPPLSPLPLIQPTGGHRMSGGDLVSEQRDRESGTEDAKHTTAPQPHPASDTLLLPKHMLEIFRSRRMPIASPAYFQQHLRDGDGVNSKVKGERRLVPSRLQVTKWDQWNKEHQYDEDESERDAMTAVVTATKNRPLPGDTESMGEKAKYASESSPKRQIAATISLTDELEPMTPAFKRQRLREILSSPVEPNEHNVRQLRALAQRVNTSVMTSLGSEITRVRHQEHQTRQAMHSMILQERERLPLKFLFQLPGGAAYCRHRMRRAMALWILEFEDNQRRMALMQWKAIVEHARFLERGQEYHRQATKRRLKVAIDTAHSS